MTYDSNSLVVIPRSDWGILRDLYSSQKTVSTGFGLLQCLTNWVQQNPELDIEIFSLNGDWKLDGTFVAKAFSTTQNQIYCNTLTDSLERLTAALNCLDIDKKYLIAGFPKRILPAVEQFFVDSGTQIADMKPDATFWYHISRVEVERIQIVIPPGIRIAQLEVSHADYINSVWPHRMPDSLQFVQHLILYNDSVGAFDDNGELMAYCLQLPFGAIGLLRVKEKHRGKGLAQLVVREMAKRLLAKHFEVLAPVVTENIASRSLFEKLGFKVVDQVFWVF